MKKLHFYIVDVFAEQKYAGNQLAVFLVDDTLSSELMQTIARETNFAETTFVLAQEPRNGGFDVKIFTPAEELPFAGHPTLGTAHVIREHILRKPVDEIVLNLKLGQIPVRFAGDGIPWMTQQEPEFGAKIDAPQIADVLSLGTDDVDTRHPIQSVSTGMPFTIVPLRDLSSLKKARLSHPHYEEIIKDAGVRAILMFCPGGYESHQDVSVRMFAPDLGVAEDAATGSGNGCLAAYLAKHRYLGTSRIDIKAAQGYEIRRPSTLYLRARQNDDRIAVQVGGKVVDIAEGDFV